MVSPPVTVIITLDDSSWHDRALCASTDNESILISRNYQIVTESEILIVINSLLAESSGPLLEKYYLYHSYTRLSPSHDVVIGSVSLFTP